MRANLNQRRGGRQEVDKIKPKKMWEKLALGDVSQAASGPKSFFILSIKKHEIRFFFSPVNYKREKKQFHVSTFCCVGGFRGNCPGNVRINYTTSTRHKLSFVCYFPSEELDTLRFKFYAFIKNRFGFRVSAV